MYKEINKTLYCSNIMLLRRYHRKMQILKCDLEKKISKGQGDLELLDHRLKMTNLDIEEIELLIDYLEKVPFKEY